MIRHYIKVAIRNLLRYKTQSIISIVGLAVGFACFALATLWIRWETTFDDFHPDADRIYRISQKDERGITALSPLFPFPLAAELKKVFPEIESSCMAQENQSSYTQEFDPLDLVLELGIDSCFLELFSIRLLGGNTDFLNDSSQVALTKEVASKNNVTALVEGWGEHSILPFKALRKINRQSENDWVGKSVQVWIKLKKGTNVELFREKLYAYQSPLSQLGDKITHLEIVPIKQCRSQLQAWKLVVEFRYLILFSITGALVIVCALFNYLSLYANRLRMRVREMALRKVCGSSHRKLFALLSMEFVWVLLLACTLGMAMIELILPAFQAFTGVGGSVYGESLFYFAVLMLLAMLIFLLVVYYFHKQTLQRTLKGTADRRGYAFFYRTSMVLQLAIGILFIFCISVIVKQMNHLRQADIGMERKNIATFYTQNTNEEKERIPVAIEILRQIPLLTEVVDDTYSLFPNTYGAFRRIEDWEGKLPAEGSLWISQFLRGETITKFYKLRLLQGELFSDSTDNTGKVLINEACAQIFGWSDPVGKKIEELTVIGVLRDFHITSPTSGVIPVMVLSEQVRNEHTNTILLKYGNHPWTAVRDSIHTRLTKGLPDMHYSLRSMEEEYEKYLKVENILLTLLCIVAVVCVLIAVFGIYSFVTLTCERRRKEIAIRKVNGARVGDILLLFLREYLLMLVVASAIAFPVGYVVMRRWLESYVEQTAISWWVYAVVFVGIACVVLLSIWARVWKAARQNPAEVIKSE